MMKKRNISIVIGFFLGFSMLFGGIALPPHPTSSNNEPLISGIADIGVVEGDIFYYHYMNEKDEPMEEMFEEEYHEGEDEGIIKVEVVDINTTDNMIYYDLFFPNITEDHMDWMWTLWNDEMEEDDSRWLQDDFTYDTFNHSFVIPTNIVSMEAENTSINMDQLIMDSFGATSIYSEYSSSAEDWHTVYFEVDQDDNESKPVSMNVYFNKSTGLLTYYEEYSENHTLILELAGFELANFDFVVPDTFGLGIGDTVDRFQPWYMDEKDGDDGDPFEDKHQDFPDWLEPNNNIGEAYDLNAFPLPSKIWGLNLHADEDYYQFYAYTGDFIEVQIEYFSGADVVVSSIDPGDESVIDHTMGEQAGDPMVFETISWNAAYDGWYYIKVNGSSGLYDDVYNLLINFNGQWQDVNDEYPPEWNMDDDHMDEFDWREPQYIRQTVEFIYYNPFMNEDVLLMTDEAFWSPTMMLEDRAGFKLFSEKSRVPLDHPNQAIGEGYFYKDIDFSSTEFQDWFTTEMIENDWNLSAGYDFTYGTDWIKVTGTFEENGLNAYFFGQQLNGVGTLRFMDMYVYNSSEMDDMSDWKYKNRDMNMVIDCSIPGAVVESHAALGVDEGDWWSYLVQEEKEWHEWGDNTKDNSDYWDNRKSVHYANFSITHVFAANLTTMVAIGKMEVFSIHQDGTMDPESHMEEFTPILIWDTANPTSFMIMGGFGDIEGPPVLLPAGVDWSTQETAILDMFATMGDGPDAPDSYNFGESSIRFRSRSDFHEEFTDEFGTHFSDHHFEQDITLEVNEFGMTTHLEQYREEHSNYWGPGYNGGHDERERMVAFMVDGSKGCVYEDDIASVTPVSEGDTFIWERSEYSPAGQWGPEDPGRDPANKTYNKYVIGDVLSACDEFVVFLGARYWKGPEDTDFHGETWHFDDGTTTGIDINYWYLSSIRDDDIWTWMESDIFDTGITDLSANEADILEMLNYAFDIPEGNLLTSDDITFNGTTFEVSMEMDKDGQAVEQVFRFAVSSQGVLQDMFMGARYVTNGTWIDWERTTLVEAESPIAGTTYDVGCVFFDDMPDFFDEEPADDDTTDDDTTDDDTTDDTTDDDTTDDDDTSSPFGEIPGYPVAVVGIVSMIATVALVFKKRK